MKAANKKYITLAFVGIFLGIGIGKIGLYIRNRAIEMRPNFNTEERSAQDKKSDMELQDISAPAGWYMHRISKANILFTKEEQLPNIGNTEAFAYGRQINVTIVNANGSAENWIEEQTQPDVLINSKQWEVINGGKVLKVGMNGGADKFLVYYIPSGDVVYEYMLYPSKIYDPSTKTYAQDEEGIKMIQTMIWQLRKEQ